MRGRATRRGAAAIAVVAALGIALAGCGSDDRVEVPEHSTADLPAETTDQVDAAVDLAMRASGASGAIVGVWAPWGGEYVAGLGSTAHEGGSDVTPDMSFRIGDVTRAMTCDVLYGLDDDGRLSADDPVTKYVTTVSGLEDVTLQDLCDSTSGLGESGSDLLVNWVRTPERAWDAREIAAVGLNKRSGEPGEAYRDSDAGYMLLGEALRHATGEEPRDLIREYVAEPYGLGSTYLPASGASTPGDDYLPGYRSSTKNVEDGCTAPADFSAASSSIGYTDSGVVSTISDLGRYGQILALESADDGQGRFDHSLPVDPDAATWLTYGGGAFQAGPLVGQAGSTLGYSTSVWSDPTTGMTVAVVLNNSHDDRFATWLGRQLAAIASRTPAADGQQQPEIGLPWSADHYDSLVTDNAICDLGDE
ncbi:serine hydrolase domain-containing protein [Microbacterium halophytorum]|uniref:serine hydrolase domain-containing protein n=1 Tax=Microbacterium halophytorum TaxID=2067568 RepID=UPI000CFB5F47|nr:serine hydrolase domain-containing protein [Microbacterium halophytorum]